MKQKMYYYTSSDTMQKILKGKNLFATNLDYMNDARECINGLEEIRKLLMTEDTIVEWKRKYPKYASVDIDCTQISNILTEQKQKHYLEENPRYSISFCEENDLLSQWITYSKESGVSIEMEFDWDNDYSYKLFDAKGERKIKAELRPRPVYYYTQDKGIEQRETAYKILNNLFEQYVAYNMSVEDYIVLPWQYLSNYIKVYDFYQEKEFRLLFESTRVRRLAQARIDYRTDKHVIKPYLDVECEYGWPITAIMVGPGFNQQVVFKSISVFLDHAEIYSRALRTKVEYRKQIEDFFFKSGLFLNDSFNIDKNKYPKYNLEREIALLSKKVNELQTGDVEDGDKKSYYIIIKEVVRKIKEYAEKSYEKSDEQIYNYFQNNYFSACGIILRKSSIPYIF